MNLSVLTGYFREASSGEELLLEIPVAFERISTGPPALLQATASVRGGSAHARGLAIHTLAPFFGPGSLASTEAIQTRPLQLRDEGDGRNTLVFVVAVGVARERPSQLTVDLSITFSNLAFLSLPVRCRMSGDGGPLATTLHHDRKLRRWIAPLNLALLLAVLVGSLHWTQWVARNTYLDTSSISLANMMATLLGASLAFFGLSFDRLRSWAALFTDSYSVAQWPELHVNPTLFRLIRTPAATCTLAVLAIAATTAMTIYRPVAAVPLPTLAIVDTAQGARVIQRMLLHRDLAADPQRFALVCKDADGKPVSDGNVLGHWTVDGPKYVQVSTTRPHGGGRDEGIEHWLKSHETGADAIRKELCTCKDQRVHPLRVDSVTVTVFQRGDSWEVKWAQSLASAADLGVQSERILATPGVGELAHNFKAISAMQDQLIPNEAKALLGAETPLSTLLDFTASQLGTITDDHGAAPTLLSLTVLWTVLQAYDCRTCAAQDAIALQHVSDEAGRVLRLPTMSVSTYQQLMRVMLLAQNGALGAENRYLLHQTLADAIRVKRRTDLPRYYAAEFISSVARSDVDAPQHAFLDAQWDRWVRQDGSDTGEFVGNLCGLVFGMDRVHCREGLRAEVPRYQYAIRSSPAGA